MSWSKNLAKFNRLSWADRGLLLEAIYWLTMARLSLVLIPFRKIAPHLGQSTEESESSVDSATEQMAERIGWAVQVVARRTPWESACLAQAMSAKAMLRRRQIQSTLYLGLAKDASQSLQAHAWLRCGEGIITGKAGHERFSVISSFAEQKPLDVHPLDDIDEAKTSDIQMLFLATLNPTPQKSTAEKLHQLDPAEWDILVQNAAKQHVLTLFFARLQALDVTALIPSHLHTKMQQQYQQVTLQNLAIYRELRLINEKMQAANIPMIVLKGAYLATAVYPQIGQRFMNDLDLLLPQSKLTQVVELLHSMGWRETRQFSFSSSFEQNHHLPPFVKKGTHFFIEPHWHIAFPKHTDIFPSKYLWREATPHNFAGTQALAFQPHMQLIHLALHASYNHQFAFDIRSLCDLAMLITHKNSTIQWEQVVEKSVDWGWKRGVYLTLVIVQEIWGVAVPLNILTQLKPEHMPKNITELAKQQLLRGRENNENISVNFSQLKGSKLLPEKTRFFLSFVLPTRNFISWRYGVSPQSIKIWFYYLINFRDLVKRNAWRSWRMLRGQSYVTEAMSRRNQLSEWLAKTK